MGKNIRGFRNTRNNNIGSRQNLSPNLSEDTEIFEVEEVVGKKRIKGRWNYEIKWKGYEEATWEPKENLNCPQLVSEFEETLGKSAIRKGHHVRAVKHTTLKSPEHDYHARRGDEKVRVGRIVS